MQNDIVVNASATSVPPAGGVHMPPQSQASTSAPAAPPQALAQPTAPQSLDVHQAPNSVAPPASAQPAPEAQAPPAAGEEHAVDEPNQTENSQSHEGPHKPVGVIMFAIFICLCLIGAAIFLALSKSDQLVS